MIAYLTFSAVVPVPYLTLNKNNTLSSVLGLPSFVTQVFELFISQTKLQAWAVGLEKCTVKH
jgi:carbon starvation protein CstA